MPDWLGRAGWLLSPGVRRCTWTGVLDDEPETHDRRSLIANEPSTSRGRFWRRCRIRCATMLTAVSGTVIAPIATRSGCEYREGIAGRPGPGELSSPLIQAECR